jgi:hypothetical protein
MDGYEYDDIRRPRWLLIGAAVLVGGVLLAAGFGAGRASAPTAGPAPGSASSGQTGPGSTHVVNGVPVGYAHTEAGAVAAATNFLMVVDGPLITQPDKYRSAIDTLAAPQALAKLRQNADGNLANLQNLTSYAEQGRTVVFRSVPLAYQVGRSGDDSVEVSIWSEALLAVDGVLSLRETWATTALTVVWTNTDWRLSSMAAPTASSFGPAPTMAQAPEQSVNLPAQLATYRRYTVNAGG